MVTKFVLWRQFIYTVSKSEAYWLLFENISFGLGTLKIATEQISVKKMFVSTFPFVTKFFSSFRTISRWVFHHKYSRKLWKFQFFCPPPILVGYIVHNYSGGRLKIFHFQNVNFSTFSVPHRLFFLLRQGPPAGQSHRPQSQPIKDQLKFQYQQWTEGRKIKLWHFKLTTCTNH